MWVLRGDRWWELPPPLPGTQNGPLSWLMQRGWTEQVSLCLCDRELPPEKGGGDEDLLPQ